MIIMTYFTLHIYYSYTVWCYVTHDIWACVWVYACVCVGYPSFTDVMLLKIDILLLFLLSFIQFISRYFIVSFNIISFNAKLKKI